MCSSHSSISPACSSSGNASGGKLSRSVTPRLRAALIAPKILEPWPGYSSRALVASPASWACNVSYSSAGMAGAAYAARSPVARSAWSSRDRQRRQKRQRVEGHAVAPELEVEMGAGAPARAAGDPERPAGLDDVARLDYPAREVRVERLDPAAEVDEHDVPVALEARRRADGDHSACRGSGDRERGEDAD